MAESLPIDARSLLAAAAKYLDESPELLTHARRAWRGGFASGAEWMRRALELLRGRAVQARTRAFHLFGLAKYGIAGAAAAIFAAMMLWAGWPFLMLGAVLVFYSIEAQLVFLFPLLLDSSRGPLCDSLRWNRAAGGTITVMGTVMRLAFAMIFGGLAGGGFVRSWCIGCLAVCIWYERLRLAPAGLAQTLRASPRARSALHIRTERIDGWNLPRPLRVLFISDLHLGHPWTRRAASQVIWAARTARPDVILLGGDLLDHPRGALVLERCTALLALLAPVYAVEGNHDRRVGVQTVRDAIAKARATWLEQATPLVGWDVTLVSKIDGAPIGCRRILCAHDPSIFPSAARANIDLTFAGHLHGGQCVLFQHAGRLYPGAWFAKWTGLRFQIGNSTLLVSRGAADTLPLRWNCPREVILCEIC